MAVRRRVALALLAALGVAWAIPGPVPALIARQEAILLGRYTVGHFAGLALASVAVGLAAALLWSRRSLTESAGVAALFALSTLAGVAAVGTLARQRIAPRYVEMPVASVVGDPVLRARLAGRVLVREAAFRWDVVREDLPAPGRSYAPRVSGRPSRAVVLSTDDRGLRNAPRAGRYDVVVAGDSFTEGSMVSDDETWWSLVARDTGLRIYNTAVSGLTVREYLNNWAAFGLDSGAKRLVVMLYEGNDWKPLPDAAASPPAALRPPRRASSTPSAAAPCRRGAATPGPLALRRGRGSEVMRAGFFDFVFGGSPLRGRAELALVQLLAPIGASWPPPPSPGLEWMPVALRVGSVTNHYAFEPKHMMRLDWDPAAFEAASEWTTNEVVLRDLVAIARERGVEVVVAYAPSKPHVLLPLVRDQVSAEALHAFALFRDRSDRLPPPDAFRERLFARLDTQEQVLGRWCAAQGIEYLPLTAPLREAMGQGVPVYFTYDPHWTEQGHVVVARALSARLASP